MNDIYFMDPRLSSQDFIASDTFTCDCLQLCRRTSMPIVISQSISSEISGSGHGEFKVLKNIFIAVFLNWFQLGSLKGNSHLSID